MQLEGELALEPCYDPHCHQRVETEPAERRARIDLRGWTAQHGGHLVDNQRSKLARGVELARIGGRSATRLVTSNLRSGQSTSSAARSGELHQY